MSLTLEPKNPAELAYPATLPIELAMRTATVRELCEAYGLSEADWDQLRQSPMFIADVARAVEMLRQDGMSFKMKARLQADELLKRSWKLIHASHEDVPPSVQADLIKFTVRVAGLDAGLEKASNLQGNALSIQINLG